MKDIVILGASYGGVSTAHRLLKQASKTGAVKVTLIGSNSHFFWNLATPRAIIEGQFPDDKLFKSIASGFRQYTDKKFEFVLGTAEKLDVRSNTVSVTTASGQRTIDYDILILATGSKTRGDAPWKHRESYESTLQALHDFQTRVKKATSIVVGGAGPTGVETAAELGFEYGRTKKITLISSGDRVLVGTPASLSKAATNKLQEFKVTLKLTTKINSETKLPDGRTELTLSDGQKIITDLYLPTTGLEPNSSYIPGSYLNAGGFVVVDEFLRLKGAPDVWAVGDVSSVQPPQFVNTEKQSVHVAKNVGLLMQGKELVPYPTNGMAILAVPLGRKAGTGRMGNWKLPSFMVNAIKTKTYFTQNLLPTLEGTSL